jgi:tetratricopeptide (TPR) repeat protein
MSKSARDIALVLLFVVCVGAAYANVFHVPFIFDDVNNIVLNNVVHGLTPLRRFFHSEYSFAGRPLTTFSFALNYRFNRLDVRGYHLLNLAIHLIAGLALFGVLRRTLLTPALRERFGRDATLLAALTALLWLAHPLQTQAVTYLTQRLESLSGLLVLTTMYCAIRGLSGSEGRHREGKAWKGLAVISCLAAVLAKESGAVAPVLALGYDAVFFRRTLRESLRASPGMYAGFAVCLVFLAYVIVTGGQWGSGPGHSRFTHAQYLLTQPEALIRYLQLVFWPAGQSLDYGWPRAVYPHALVSLIPVLALLAVTLWAFFRRFPAGYAGFWCFVALAPTSLMLLPDAVVEYRMYLALAGLLALLTLGGYAALASSGRRGLGVGAALACLAVVGLAGASYERNKAYASDVAIWTDTAIKSPYNPRAYANLANALIEAGRPAEALPALEAAARLEPLSHESLVNYGQALLLLGRPAEAIPRLEAAIRRAGFSAAVTLAWFKLGEAYFQLGDEKSGLRSFAQVCSRPGGGKKLDSIAVVLASAGKIDVALQLFKAALTMDPGNLDKQSNVAVALYKLGRVEEARLLFEDIANRSPGHPTAFKYLGFIRYAREQSPAADPEKNSVPK